MLEEVRRAIEAAGLATTGEALWVAVSGGVDSMVLLHVLRALGHPCKVAHVDHGLRAGASEADREFVRSYCAERAIPFEVELVDVRSRASATGESIQMAARSLRLQWFNELALRGPHKVATAHHADDAIETFFLGLVKGLGAKGWGSIPAQHGVFVRPLLDVSRADIIAYAERNKVPWREDASNADTAYLRNRIRHELLPMLERWRPGTHRNLRRNIRLFGELDTLGRLATRQALQGLSEDEHGVLRVPFDRVLGPSPLVVMHALLRDKGFHPDRFDDLLEAIRQRHCGARFPGPEVEVFVDRDQLVIVPNRPPPGSWSISGLAEWPLEAPVDMQLCAGHEIDPQAGSEVVWLDQDQLKFPLELRPWKPGDRMRPAGLGGSKLISDILIDAKVPLDRKSRCYVLADADRILWLCGFRLAEGAKAGPGSGSVVRLRWSET